VSEIPPYPTSREEAAAPPTAQSTSGYAIASLVLGIVGIFVFPVVGSILALIFGYIARNEIDRSSGRQGGRGLAIAGIVLGWVGVVFGIVLLLILLLFAAALNPTY
jgi:MFS family permease